MLELFQRILQDEQLSASKDQPSSDLKKLIEYILKKFFKAAKERPMLMLEVGHLSHCRAGKVLMDIASSQAFFPKNRKQLGKLRTGDIDYAESSEDDGPGFKVRPFAHCLPPRFG